MRWLQSTPPAGRVAELGSLGIMHIRPGKPSDAHALASLIASFQPILTLEPSGAGAEQFLASVSRTLNASTWSRLAMRIWSRNWKGKW